MNLLQVSNKGSEDSPPTKGRISTSGSTHQAESITRMFIRRSFDAIKDTADSRPGIIFMILAIMMLKVGISKTYTITFMILAIMLLSVGVSKANTIPGLKVLVRTTKQKDAMRRYSMRQTPHSFSA